MNKLADVDTDALQAALATTASVKATKRLMIALAYADGVRVETLSERLRHPARDGVLVARPIRTAAD